MIVRCNKAASWVLTVVLAGTAMTGCQNPATADETVNYNDALTVSVSPDPIQADNQTGGKTYRVVRGNNQPDELLPYDWHAIFTSSIVLTQTATDEKLNLDFPVRVTGATLAIKQATGGIITPPTGTDTEKYEYVPLSATGNQFTAVGSPLSLTVEMWYDLPSLRKECVVTLTYAFVDTDGTSFSRSVDFNVAP